MRLEDLVGERLWRLSRSWELREEDGEPGECFSGEEGEFVCAAVSSRCFREDLLRSLFKTISSEPQSGRSREQTGQ